MSPATSKSSCWIVLACQTTVQCLGGATYECITNVGIPCILASVKACDSAARAVKYNRAPEGVGRKRLDGHVVAEAVRRHAWRDQDGAGGQRQIRKDTQLARSHDESCRRKKTPGRGEHKGGKKWRREVDQLMNKGAPSLRKSRGAERRHQRAGTLTLSGSRDQLKA